MKMFPALLAVSLAFLTGCAPARRDDADAFKLDLPGPTLAARVPEGYELKNRHIRVVIDDKSGDVAYWGSVDGARNLLTAQPVRIIELGPGATFIESHSVGYVEARDDQTWQYLGEDDANKIGWRKIYCLNGDDLNISLLSQNRGEARMVCFGLSGGNDFEPALVKQIPDTEHFLGRSAFGTVQFHGFNENHNQLAMPPFLLVADAHLLRPGERISWTMQWRCKLSAATAK
jgi:hypothetical protein